MVEQTRGVVASYGRDDGDEDVVAVPDARRAAEDAITRVGGVLKFVAGSDEPLADELRTLYEAVAPILGRA